MIDLLRDISNGRNVTVLTVMIDLLRDISNDRNVTVLTVMLIAKVHQKEWRSRGSVDIFLHSIEKRKLKYTPFVGDRDSASFGSLGNLSRRRKDV